MKLQYWGTAACEGIPAIFCMCETCKRSRALGGRNIRLRSQAMLDNSLLIDFNPDTYVNSLRYGFDLADLRHLLITHTHADHFYPEELVNRGSYFCKFAGDAFPLTVYGSGSVTDRIKRMVEGNPKVLGGRLAYKTLCAFEPVQIDKYTVTPLPARHGGDPFVYQISAEGKTLLYGNDSGLYPEQTWAYWQANGVRFDYVSMDCTEACRPINYDHHMNLERNIAVRDRMLSLGIADEKTVFVCNHFSHNGHSVIYDQFLPIAQEKGFLVSYDGMEAEI